MKTVVQILIAVVALVVLGKILAILWGISKFVIGVLVAIGVVAAVTGRLNQYFAALNKVVERIGDKFTH